jgi:succinate-semialdehyde dehydrogenase/glutarate-semialdehyde dehydrogenase
MSLESINPYTNKSIRVFEEYTDTKLDEMLIQSGEAFDIWKRTTFGFRESVMKKAASLMIRNIDEYAESITSEMGKPVTDADISFVTYEPLGTILGIMPWNFPFWQVFRFAAPTLMAGNTILLKHASNVQICAQHIENIFTESGFPPSVFSNLVIGSEKVEKIIKHDCVKAVSLTGSEFTGQKVAETAGREIKKTLLELGGSNAFVVLSDADIEKAVAIGVKARMQNAGQSCIAAKRFIIHEKVSEKFIALFAEALNTINTGDPAKEDTDLGPLAGIKQAETVEEQVKLSVEMGARVIAGGIRDKAFYLPTLLADVRPGMPVFDEEVFGPVAPVIIAKDTPEAIRLANNTKFGLGVSLFTSDLKKALDLVPEFHDGAVFINSMVKSDPRLPFGGTKHSGFGRELAIQGIREFVNIKTVFILKL